MSTHHSLTASQAERRALLELLGQVLAAAQHRSELVARLSQALDTAAAAAAEVLASQGQAAALLAPTVQLEEGLEAALAAAVLVVVATPPRRRWSSLEEMAETLGQ
jgi:hypothetical protein